MHPEVRQVGPGRLPDLRHGARAGRGDRRQRPQSRARRHDAAVLDRARADRSGVRAGDGRSICSACMLVGQTLSNWMQFVVRDAGGAVGRLAVLRARLAVARHAQPQHVHADRDGHRRRLGLQRRRDARAATFSRRRSAATTARSRSISRPPPSSPCWCCSARCWSCARASGPPARSARCSISRRRPRAAFCRAATSDDVPLDAVAVGDLLRVRPGEKVPVDGVLIEGRSRGRRVDGDRRVDAGRPRTPGAKVIARHAQPDRQLRDARREGRPRHHAGADRADGGAGAALARADPAAGRPGVGLVRAGGDRGRAARVRSPGRCSAPSRAMPMAWSPPSPC